LSRRLGRPLALFHHGEMRPASTAKRGIISMLIIVDDRLQLPEERQEVV
jgi:hypothetical protein